MKQVGILKKRGAGSALHRDGTGRLITGWVGEHAVHGKADQMQKMIDDAKDGLAGHPNKPAYPAGDWPNLKTDPVGYEHHRDQSQFCRLWDQWQSRAGCQVVPSNTIFEDILVYTGYSKGQSSFTLDFVASDGSIVKFGPKSTGLFVGSLIEGTHIKVVEAVCVRGPDEHRPDPLKPGDFVRDEEGRWLKFPTLFTGRAVELKFYFVKQGSNIYAQVYTGVE